MQNIMVYHFSPLLYLRLIFCCKIHRNSLFSLSTQKLLNETIMIQKFCRKIFTNTYKPEKWTLIHSTYQKIPL